VQEGEEIEISVEKEQKETINSNKDREERKSTGIFFKKI
jgi:hypothetical protein